MLFVELAKQLNFTRAAATLGISKGYLSGQVKKLEQELQCPLLIRTTRSVRLTREGERLYAQGLQIRSQLYQLEQSVHEEHETLTGLLRVTAPKMFAERYLFGLCEAFSRQHPGIQFEINCSYTTFNLNLQDIDIGFRATNTPPDNMVANRILGYHHLLVAAPQYLSLRGVPQTVSDLANHDCLATLHQRHWPLKSEEVRIHGWLSTNENHLLKQQALSGQGIIRIASYYVQDELESGRLQQVLPDEVIEAGNSIYLFYPQLVYPSVKLRTFTEFIKTSFMHFQP